MNCHSFKKDMTILGTAYFVAYFVAYFATYLTAYFATYLTAYFTDLP